MKLIKSLTPVMFTLMFCSHTGHANVNISGSTSIQQRYFTQPAQFPQQTRSQISLAIAPEIDFQVGDAGDFRFVPFARADQRDDERTHADIREAMYSLYLDSWEFKLGIGRVFWGQTESVHLVDIINQTDLVESIDSEDKLGQPMLDAKYLLDTGYISFFVLPYFRERTFPGVDGRLRGPFEIDIDNPLYESDDEESHIDYAVRWQQSIGSFEIGLSFFDGTDRLPELLPDVDPETGQVRLQPFYSQLQQVGLDALFVWDSWLFKLEALQGERLDENFGAVVAGFEYTLVDAFGSGFDVGILSEYQYDERDTNAFIFGQNDLMIGTRINFNDFSGTEILLAFVQDLDESSSYSAVIEASTRLTGNWRLEFNGYFFSSDSPVDPTFFISQDDHISLELAYYF